MGISFVTLDVNRLESLELSLRYVSFSCVQVREVNCWVLSCPHQVLTVRPSKLFHWHIFLTVFSVFIILSGPSRSTAGLGKTFLRGRSGEKIFEQRRGLLNVAGPGVTYPSTLSSQQATSEVQLWLTLSIC